MLCCSQGHEGNDQLCSSKFLPCSRVWAVRLQLLVTSDYDEIWRTSKLLGKRICGGSTKVVLSEWSFLFVLQILNTCWCCRPQETMVGSAAPHGYGNSGAFQEASESWERPSVPSGPSLGDGRASRPTGGKPDWYRIISENDNKNAKQDGARSKIYGFPSQVLTLISGIATSM